MDYSQTFVHIDHNALLQNLTDHGIPPPLPSPVVLGVDECIPPPSSLILWSKLIICEHSRLAGKAMNHLWYADDLCLLTMPSKGMQTLLQICEEYATEHVYFISTKRF